MRAASGAGIHLFFNGGLKQLFLLNMSTGILIIIRTTTTTMKKALGGDTNTALWL